MDKKMNKKKLTLLIMTGLLAVNLTACQNKTSKEDPSDNTQVQEDSRVQEDNKAQEDSEGQEDSKEMEDSKSSKPSGTQKSSNASYRKVLNNELSLISTDEGGAETYLKDLTYNGASKPIPYNVTQFAYLDLDLDSEKEIVLALDTGYDGAFEVLKEIDGTVYGYYFNYRSMIPLYADGSMLGSSGAADNKIYRWKFSTTGCTSEVLDSSADIDSTKKRATWYDFTTSNIDKVLGNGSASESASTSKTKTSGSLLNIDQKTQGYVFFGSDTEYLLEEELQYIPTEILRIAKNEIYARHGYRFTSDMKTFFEKKSWYTGNVSASDWSDSKFNTYEKKNVNLLKKYESLETKVPFSTSSVAEGTLIRGDGFTLTLPSVWNDSNYFVTKTGDENADVYGFYSKNNFAYGYGGHVFSLLVYQGPMSEEDSSFCDNLVSLGNDGNRYYYMAQSTDVQRAHDISALDSEWKQLSDTYEQIADSFEI